MGSEDFYSDERPVRQMHVGPFWIDQTPITNSQFTRFVDATGYVTFAEVAPDPVVYREMDPALAVAGSIVFAPPDRPVDLDGGPGWWRYVEGADWRHPNGPGSGITGLERHPVVHVASCDAVAYAEWCGKALPTEAEWEYAARGGLNGARYAWGEDFTLAGRRMAKTWYGVFPFINMASAGLERTAPVKSYPPNGYGLYDMIGNVWEWTADEYTLISDLGNDEPRCCGSLRNSMEMVPRKVLKGGSHLCAPEYCQRYRPAARWPQPIDTTTSHVGFRCIVRPDDSRRLLEKSLPAEPTPATY